MKLIITPNSNKVIDKTINIVDAYILPLKNLSVNYEVYYSLDEVIELTNLLIKNNKQVFVSLNKNFTNKELDNLSIVLNKLNDSKITGILYYDVALVNLKSKLDLKYDLVWNAEHLTTNYFTCNYWYQKGINYAVLSNEITLNEIIEIKENTNMTLIVPVFGYIPLFTSFRHAIKNYLKTFSLTDNSKINYLEKEGNIYPIIDNELGTTVFSSKILNASKDLKKLDKNNIDYILLTNTFINDDEFVKVLNDFKNFREVLVPNSSDYFFHKETIYKVK